MSDEQKVALYNRGNHFRRQGEFDKALAVYEQIIREDDTDAEAHWCCAISRFGIEYVEDPISLEWFRINGFLKEAAVHPAMWLDLASF